MTPRLSAERRCGVFFEKMLYAFNEILKMMKN